MKMEGPTSSETSVTTYYRHVLIKCIPIKLTDLGTKIFTRTQKAFGSNSCSDVWLFPLPYRRSRYTRINISYVGIDIRPRNVSKVSALADLICQALLDR
jgi:hypothetical protein